MTEEGVSARGARVNMVVNMNRGTPPDTEQNLQNPVPSTSSRGGSDPEACGKHPEALQDNLDGEIRS